VILASASPFSSRDYREILQGDRLYKSITLLFQLSPIRRANSILHTFGGPKGIFLILDANWEVWVKYYAMLSSGGAPKGTFLILVADREVWAICFPGS